MEKSYFDLSLVNISNPCFKYYLIKKKNKLIIFKLMVKGNFETGK